VQVLAETGVVGFVILCFGVGATGIAVWRSRRKPGAVAAAGCLAAVVALAVHSATDYLWHIPIIPLLGAVLVAVVLPGTEPEPAGLDGDR
jgi:O-antigen ligase